MKTHGSWTDMPHMVIRPELVALCRIVDEFNAIGVQLSRLHLTDPDFLTRVYMTWVERGKPDFVECDCKAGLPDVDRIPIPPEVVRL